MEPITMILTALVTGLSAGLGKTAEKAIGELFNNFISHLKQKVSSKPDAEQALNALESKPNSEGRKAVLKEELELLEVQKDSELIELALAVLKQSDPEGSRAGKYAVNINGGQGITIGDHARVTQTFNTPPGKPQSR